MVAKAIILIECDESNPADWPPVRSCEVVIGSLDDSPIDLVNTDDDQYSVDTVELYVLV